MNPHTLGALINLDSTSRIASPSPALRRNSNAAVIPPISHELEELSSKSHPSVPSEPSTPNGNQTPITPSELEMSRPPTPRARDAADVVQSLSNPPKNKWRLLSACLMSFGNGLNDSAPGALIPYMESEYRIGYAIVSLIFVSNALGFIGAAPLVHILQARLGRAKTLVLAEALLILAYIMLACRPPFPVVVVSFFLIGLGLAFNLALNNVFCANMVNSTTLLGAFHGSYGIGGTVGPLMATGLVSNGRHWSSFYYIALTVACLNLVFAAWAFLNYETDLTNPLVSALERQASRLNHPTPSRPSRDQEDSGSKSTLLKQAIRNKTTILGALFIFAYQGAEVSISGWVISFLISYRHSPADRVGFVTAGFWAGITLGRFLLSHPCHKIGEKTAVVGLVFGAMAFQLSVWLVPNVVGEAVAVSIVGLLLGPVYPCSTAVFSRLLPRKLQMSSLSFVSAMGSSGGAVAPFFTGLLAQQVGTWVLHPICIGLFASMLVCWCCLPRISKRSE
ncbi:hypothetical protein MMC20_000281 [Loxospora ochrophaea]|nr:hypothetical protein [Loxospora ochrophaea]